MLMMSKRAAYSHPGDSTAGGHPSRAGPPPDDLLVGVWSRFDPRSDGRDARTWASRKWRRRPCRARLRRRATVAGRPACFRVGAAWGRCELEMILPGVDPNWSFGRMPKHCRREDRNRFSGLWRLPELTDRKKSKSFQPRVPAMRWESEKAKRGVADGACWSSELQPTSCRPGKLRNENRPGPLKYRRPATPPLGSQHRHLPLSPPAPTTLEEPQPPPDGPPPASLHRELDCFGVFINQNGKLLHDNKISPIMEKLSLTAENYGSVRRYFIQSLDDRMLSLDALEKLVWPNPPHQVFKLKASNQSGHGWLCRANVMWLL
ncbi:hypothetical protein KSP40_PGU005927 [Platanthera guangdongensis]|uniref:Uncharacterized protein n=1 Tax=Platanthera guangdongensis TaxID=2320717 RepID=A0ABR2LN55_9ASPA